MTITPIDQSQLKALRTAAVFYLLMIISAPIGLLYVPSTLIVPGDATATADHIRASEWLFRIGMGSELFHQVIAIFLVLALYRLFKPVNEQHAKLMVILGALVSVPIMFINVLNEIAALILVNGADFLSVFSKSQLDALALLFLRLHEQGIEIVGIFWGLWLFPFGILVVRSGFIPRLLGVLLFIAGTGLLASSFTFLLLPQYGPLVGQIATVLDLVGEFPTIIWFFIRALWPSRITEPDRISS
jgi:hypothetical protein